MKAGLVWRPIKLLQLLAVLLLIAASAFVTTPTALAAGATIYVDPGTSGAGADNINASLRLSADDNKITYVNFNLTYDRNKLEFAGSDYSNSPFSNPGTGGRGGSISVSAGSMDDRVSGDVPIINLSFKILDRTGSTRLDINNAGVYNDAYVNIASSTSGAVYDFDGNGSTNPDYDPHTPPAVTPAPAVAVDVSSAPARPAAMPPARRNNAINAGAGAPAASQNTAVPTEPETVVIPAGITAPRDEFPDRKGSVFIATKPSQLPPANSTNWRLPLMVGIPGLAIAALAFRRRITDLFMKQSYEVIPPLASLWPDREEEPFASSLEPVVPFIPIADPGQASTSEEEIDQSWKYDINSPLMNTL